MEAAAATLLLIAASAPAVASAAVPGQRRVGGPTAPSDSKVAVVSSADPLVGERFVVAADGRTVMAGTLQAADASPSP